MDDILGRAGIPRKYRGPLKQGAHALAEKGIEKALDSALDQTGMSDAEKRALKEALKRAAETIEF